MGREFVNKWTIFKLKNGISVERYMFVDEEEQNKYHCQKCKKLIKKECYVDCYYINQFYCFACKEKLQVSKEEVTD